MQLKTPRAYARDAIAYGNLTGAEKAVAAAMHDFIMLLCQADYEGRATITIIDDILRVLDRADDPRQLELEF